MRIAIGFFDGVHLGHQKILSGADVAITFKNHPMTVLRPEKAPQLIMSLEDRIAAIRSCGVSEVVALDFTPELAALPPEEFVARYLSRGKDSAAPVNDASDSWGCGILSAPAILCGANWRFGKGGAGTPDWLRAHGIDVEVVEAAEYEGARISSTRIRECLLRGEIAAANAMLGRRFRVTGNRERGKGEGAKLGYPTVNLSLRSSSLFTLHSSLPLGVYAVEVLGHKAIANYGVAPTFGAQAWKEAVLEVHFVEKDPSFLHSSFFILDSSFTVEFLRFLRPERKFGSVEELKRQIAADIADLV